MKAGITRSVSRNVRHARNVGPLISVLMTVRNDIKYVGEAIDSIAGQTLSDWELIVTDTGSRDGTDVYVQRRAAEDSRIVFYRYDEALGVAGNLSAALALSRGEWIASMYPEDRAMPNRLERQLAFMLQNREVPVVSCLAYYVNADGERMPSVSPGVIWREAYEGHTQNDDLIGVLHPGAFMRRETLLRAGSHHSYLDTGDDIELRDRLAEAGAIFVQPEYLMEYHVEDNSQAARFLDMAYLKQFWAEECVSAARAGNSEPTWEQFLWRQGLRRKGNA